MRDRLPAPGKGNRVRITLDNGQVVEGVLSYADDATQQGSAYTKGNVLPDNVCQALGLDPDTSEPKDAFMRFSLIPSGEGGLIVWFSDSEGNAAGGTVTVGGQTVASGAGGAAVLFLPPGSYDVSVNAPLDCDLVSASLFTVNVRNGEYTNSYVEVS